MPAPAPPACPPHPGQALLLKKPVHLLCDAGEARILSPARFAVMVAARGCLLEGLVLKSHQIDESAFFIVDQGPACRYVGLRGCEVLQGSFLGIQDLKGPNTRMVLERCKLGVGVCLMAGRLDMSDCVVKGTGDSLQSYPGEGRRCSPCRAAPPSDLAPAAGCTTPAVAPTHRCPPSRRPPHRALRAPSDTTLVLRRCEFIDFVDPLLIESGTAIIEGCRRAGGLGGGSSLGGRCQLPGAGCGTACAAWHAL